MQTSAFISTRLILLMDFRLQALLILQSKRLYKSHVLKYSITICEIPKKGSRRRVKKCAFLKNQNGLPGKNTPENLFRNERNITGVIITYLKTRPLGTKRILVGKQKISMTRTTSTIHSNLEETRCRLKLFATI